MSSVKKTPWQTNKQHPLKFIHFKNLCFRSIMISLIKMMRMSTVSVRGNSSRAATAARPVTAVRAAGYTSTTRDIPTRDDVKEDRYTNK